MELTYLFHSGFALETESAVLIFDYWHDPAGCIPDILSKGKPVYVFSSHFHEDHFTREIFGWRTSDRNIRYILSKDIRRKYRDLRDWEITWMAKGAVYQDDILKVSATGSTDIGVSWVVEIDGKHIFHAGDLNNWYARFLAEENPPESIFSEEFGVEVHPIYEEKKYLGELKDILKITDHFDLAMFPVDGRIGNGYTLGGRQFIERFRVGLFVPMHFVVSGFESAWRMEEYCTAKGVDFWKIAREGESWEC